MRFSARPEFEREHKMAGGLFWGGWLSEEPDEELKQVMASEQVQIGYNSWFVFDFDLGDGRTPLDVFLEREGERLSSGERRYLEGMWESHAERQRRAGEPAYEFRWMWEELGLERE